MKQLTGCTSLGRKDRMVSNLKNFNVVLTFRSMNSITARSMKIIHFAFVV